MIPQMIYGRGFLFVSDFYIYIYINRYRVPFIFYTSCVITPSTGLMAKPQPTVTRPLVHFGAGSHPLSYCTYGCCPSMNFGSP